MYVAWRRGSISFFCTYISRCPRTTFVGKTILCSVLLSWHLFRKSVYHNRKIYFWPFISIPCIYMPLLMPGPHCVDYYSFVLSFENRKCESSKSVSFFRIVLEILNSLSLHINFRMGRTNPVVVGWEEGKRLGFWQQSHKYVNRLQRGWYCLLHNTQHVVFWSVNTKCSSIFFLDLLSFKNVFYCL